uniref:Integrin, alpha 5 (fibronectin receptor, alpha polypeptide) n=1 Tax=Hucho hucho TaxID=62062 RepID=A0A4W5LV69_9TELE
MNYSLFCIGVCQIILLRFCDTFNLDVENPSVYSGPNGSYFGYSVEFYLTNSSSVVIGAPKANTSQFNITEGGSVYYCPWSLGQSECYNIEFDNQGDRIVTLNKIDYQAEVKSHQWFGATVRSHGDTILACAPLYSWRTKSDIPQSDTTGTCYLSVKNFTKFVEYAPCRTEFINQGGQGYCQGGFSADFTKVTLLNTSSQFSTRGQVISAAKEEIIKAYYPGYFMQSVEGQTQTRQAQIKYDDSYHGKTFLSRNSITLLIPLLSKHMGSYFGYAVATADINNDGMVDLLVGAPMYMTRGSDSRLEEVGRVYLYLQRGPLDLEPTLNLTGTQVFGRFGSTITPLGDLNQDGYNDLAISCPFGGEDQQGLVLIYNGFAGGLRDTSSQVIAGQWASGTVPASFGFALRGAKDLDMNGYPDLIVGIFLYNVNLSFCLSANGKYLPDNLGFQVEVQLDHLKHKQKGGVKRALFVDSQQAVLQRSMRVQRGERVCHETKIYLRVSLLYPKLQPTNCSITAQILLDCGEDNICVPDLKLAVHGDRKEVYLGDDNSLTLTFNARNEGEGGAYEAELYVVLPPEADYSGIARNNESLTQLTCSYEAENQTRYLSCDLGNPMKSGTSLWAGLRFTVPRLKDTRKTVQFELQIRSKNENNSHSEVVPYKLEVVVQADVILQGVSRPDKVFFPPPNWKVSKAPQEEQDIGPAVQHVYELVNKGPSGISHTVLQLRCPFSVPEQGLLYPLEISTEGPLNCTTNHSINYLQLKLQQTSTEQPPLLVPGQDHHIERREVQRDQLAEHTNLSCSNVECWTLQCDVGLLEKGTSAILKLRSRIWAETFIERAYKGYVLECLARFSVVKMPYAILPKEVPSGSKKVVTPLVWNKPDSQYSVPLWIIILAILAGLLLLALLIYVLYKLGFFKRSLPYGTAMEKAQLKPQAASEA